MDNIELNFNEIINMIETRRNNAYKKVNEELISLYWDFGKYISEKVNDSNWGDKIVDKLVEFMKREYPTMKGFNRAGIYRMKQFYETYKDNEIVAPLVRQISWTHNVMILGATNSIEEKEFYIKMCIKNNYSKRELDRQIASGYFHRYMLSDGKTNQSLVKATGEEDYPNTRILDTYSLEFLDLPNQYSEKDLKKAIISNMKDFILEIGKDFTYVGEEYRVQVGNEDFYIDLLFYNRALSCLVAFELKIDKFKPEYISKMDFYLEALDRQEKKENENPSVGVILCASKDEKVVEYAMSRSMSPTMVSQYTLKLIDKKLLENKLKEIANIVEENIDKDMNISRHSIIIIQNSKNEYLQYFDKEWGSYLFLNCKLPNGEDRVAVINKISEDLEIEKEFIEVTYCDFRKHKKFSQSAKHEKEYIHYFYKVKINKKLEDSQFTIKDVNYKWFSYDELIQDKRIQEVNSDIVQFVKEISSK